MNEREHERYAILAMLRKRNRRAAPRETRLLNAIIQDIEGGEHHRDGMNAAAREAFRDGR